MLVNNVYSSPDLASWLGKPFWELPVEAWDEVIDIGVRSHYVAARFGVPMMVAQGSGLIVNVSSSARSSTRTPSATASARPPSTG